MGEDLKEYLKFHKTFGGTGKLFNFEPIKYSKGVLELEGEFNESTLNPNGTVQGGMMTAFLDDVTSLLVIYETKGKLFTASTDLHSAHHLPLTKGRYRARATLIKQGKYIASIKGEIFNAEGQVATTLLHTAFLVHKEIK